MKLVTAPTHGCSTAARCAAASSGASEMRAMAIALFYAIGTAAGGVIGPALFGWLIESGQRRSTP